MVDVDPRTNQPYAFMCSNFDNTYPLVIWALKLHMSSEWFDVPQAGLYAVPLDEAFSWAYAHFVLEDQMTTLQRQLLPKGASWTKQVLQYAAVVT